MRAGFLWCGHFDLGVVEKRTRLICKFPFSANVDHKANQSELNRQDNSDIMLPRHPSRTLLQSLKRSYHSRAPGFFPHPLSSWHSPQPPSSYYSMPYVIEQTVRSHPVQNIDIRVVRNVHMIFFHVSLRNE